MKKRTDPKYFQSKVEAGLYAYRGFDIWKDAARNVWVINGPSGGDFRLLTEAKAHVDRIIKFPSLRFKKKQCPTAKPNLDTSNSKPVK